MDLTSRVAIVTGGSGPLGRVVSRELVRAGATVAVSSRPGSPIIDPVADVAVFQADLSDEKQVQTFVASVQERFSRVDILVNAAGGFQGGTVLEETPVRQWYDMIDSNVTTAFLMSRAVIEGMKARHFGRIVNIAALAGLAPAGRRIPYSVAKAGVVALTRALAAEVRNTGVCVNAIAPGTILTRENRESMPDADTSSWVPPEEIAAMIIALCSPSAGRANGNIITMNS